MKVDVDTHDRSAGRLQRAERKAPAYATKAFVAADAQTDARIEQIIAANSLLTPTLSSAPAAAHGASAGR
jgi:hypothetical protein